MCGDIDRTEVSARRWGRVITVAEAAESASVSFRMGAKRTTQEPSADVVDAGRSPDNLDCRTG